MIKTCKKKSLMPEILNPVGLQDPTMQGFMWKFTERRSDWMCCFCLHVRTGTILLGVWHLMLHMLALSAITVVLHHPELMVEPQGTPTTLPSQKNTYMEFKTIGHDDKQTPDMYMLQNSDNLTIKRAFMRQYQDINVGIVVTFSTFMITLLMVYGAIRGKPSFLLPFFCLQIFDFCISSLTALSYLCFQPDMHRLVTESPRIPFQSDLVNMPSRCLSFLFIIVFVFAMFIKIYFIGVVWSCYKYLSLRLVSAQRTIHLIDPDVQGLLPDYETACKKFPAPPPSYTAATSSNAPTTSAAAAASQPASVQLHSVTSPPPAAAPTPSTPPPEYRVAANLPPASDSPSHAHTLKA